MHPRPLFAAALLCLVTALSAVDQPATLELLHRVADWQLAHPSKHKPTDWTQAAGYTGFMALFPLPGGDKYQAAMVSVGDGTKWLLGPAGRFHADDQAVGQLYLELYARLKRPEMIAETRKVMDEFRARPDAAGDLHFDLKNCQRRWNWCDSLFMAPPVLARLYALTGDQAYQDNLLNEYRRTHDFLYDQEEHLYYRDSRFFAKREANGQKVFWGRGNGWVMAGLANTLSALPKDAASRPYFEGIFKQMASRIVALQQPDGLWRASLLDPASYPLKETSGSAFYCYALAWGVNHGLLDRAATLPAVERAWAALVDCVTPEGRLTHVQPIGEDPKKFSGDATEIYGVGGFLLAGSEVYRL